MKVYVLYEYEPPSRNTYGDWQAGEKIICKVTSDLRIADKWAKARRSAEYDEFELED